MGQKIDAWKQTWNRQQFQMEIFRQRQSKQKTTSTRVQDRNKNAVPRKNLLLEDIFTEGLLTEKKGAIF